MTKYLVTLDSTKSPGSRLNTQAAAEIALLINDVDVDFDDITDAGATGKAIGRAASQADARSAIDVPSTGQMATAIGNAKSEVIGGAGGAYDTLKEIQDLMVADDGALAALTTAVGQKYVKPGGGIPQSDLAPAAIAAFLKSPLGAKYENPRGVGFPDLSMSITTAAPSYAADKSIPWSSSTKFRVGGILQDYFGNGLNAINGASPGDLPGWTSYEYEFYFRGRYFAPYVYASQISDFRIIVDDVWTTQKWQTFPTAGGAFFIAMDFGSDAVRKIRILMPGCAMVQSFRMPATADMWPAEPRKKVVFVGDSYVQGPTTTSEGALYGGNVAGEYAAKTGMEVWNLGQGGTGRLSDGGGGNGISAYGSASRMAALAAVPGEIDHIIDYGGANDSALNQVNVIAASNAYWTAVKAARPTVPLIVVGPEPGALAGFSVPNMNSLNTALKAAALAHPGVAYYVDQRSWVTGTGKVGAPANDGSADFFMSSDGIHPSHAGFDNISNRMVRELRGVRV